MHFDRLNLPPRGADLSQVCIAGNGIPQTVGRQATASAQYILLKPNKYCAQVHKHIQIAFILSADQLQPIY